MKRANLENIARERRRNAALATLAAQQLRACQRRAQDLDKLASDELDRIERRRERRGKGKP